MDAFLADESPEAFAKVVDRLLASPAYGERWGRHWLDVVRYTDAFDARGIGGEADVPAAWRYRDWVVGRVQPRPAVRPVRLRADRRRPAPPRPAAAAKAGLIATGVYAIGEWGGGDADKEKMLTDIVDDQVDVIGRAFLGLTLACARCHDHKFDPIPQADYYVAGRHLLLQPHPPRPRRQDGGLAGAARSRWRIRRTWRSGSNSSLA